VKALRACSFALDGILLSAIQSPGQIRVQKKKKRFARPKRLPARPRHCAIGSPGSRSRCRKLEIVWGRDARAHRPYERIVRPAVSRIYAVVPTLTGRGEYIHYVPAHPAGPMLAIIKRRVCFAFIGSLTRACRPTSAALRALSGGPAATRGAWLGPRSATDYAIACLLDEPPLGAWMPKLRQEFADRT